MFRSGGLYQDFMRIVSLASGDPDYIEITALWCLSGGLQTINCTGLHHRSSNIKFTKI